MSAYTPLKPYLVLDLKPSPALALRLAIEPMIVVYLSAHIGAPLGYAIVLGAVALAAGSRHIKRYVLRRDPCAIVCIEGFESGEIVFVRRDGRRVRAQLVSTWWDFGPTALIWRPLDLQVRADETSSRRNNSWFGQAFTRWRQNQIDYIGPEAFDTERKRRFAVLTACRGRG